MLAIVPARGGSKGLANKNIKKFNGIPLIIHTLKAAIKSKYISRIIVSSDDEKILSICRKIKGIEIPYKRPKYLAKDNSIVTDTFFHLFDWIKKKEGTEPKEFCVLQPTSPLRLAKDIDGAINFFYNTNANAVLSVYEIQPIFFRLSNEKKIKSLLGNNQEGMLPRQKLNNYVMQNGAVHVFNTKNLRKTKTYYSNKTYGYLMPQRRSIDIDNEIDFFLAEETMKKKLHFKD